MRDYSYRKAEEKSHDLVLMIYKNINVVSDSNSQQIAKDVQEIAVAISTSLAEGYAIDDETVLRIWLTSIIKSTHRLEALLKLAVKLGYFEDLSHKKIIEEVGEVRNLIKDAIWYMGFSYQE